MYNTREFEMMVKTLDPLEQLAIIGMFDSLKEVSVAARKSGSDFNKTLNYGLNMARSYANNNSNAPLLNMKSSVASSVGMQLGAGAPSRSLAAPVKTLPRDKPLTDLEKKVIKWCKNNLAAGRIVKVVGAKDNGYREIISLIGDHSGPTSMECHILGFDLGRTGIKSKSSLKNIRELWVEPHRYAANGQGRWDSIKDQI